MGHADVLLTQRLGVTDLAEGREPANGLAGAGFVWHSPRDVVFADCVSFFGLALAAIGGGCL